jgi:hypothetical protein
MLVVGDAAAIEPGLSALRPVHVQQDAH